MDRRGKKQKGMNAQELLFPETVEWASDNKAIFKWRALLKRELYRLRDYRSDLSGWPILSVDHCHMHEGILSRARVPLNIKWHWRIYCPYNCFLLLPHEHIPNPPPKEWAIEKAYGYYGRDNVREWFYNLPFKSVPFHLP